MIRDYMYYVRGLGDYIYDVVIDWSLVIISR